MTSNDSRSVKSLCRPCGKGRHDRCISQRLCRCAEAGHPGSPTVSYGDRALALNNEILRCLVGSGVHGMALEGTDDRDEMGICIEPAAYVCGLSRFDQHVWRTQPEGVRSGADDIDLTIYSLRKWLRLATAGNPTIVLPLYAPEDALLVRTPLGDELRDLRGWIVSREIGKRFLGYLEQQRERMLGGGRQSRVPSRPELIAAHGYDTKYASHALRLGRQGVELLTTGTLSLPMREQDLTPSLAVKRGEVGKVEALAMIDRTMGNLRRIVDGKIGPLRAAPDYDRVNEWMISAHLRHWESARSGAVAEGTS